MDICEKCGAPVKDGVCTYCGAVYKTGNNSGSSSDKVDPSITIVNQVSNINISPRSVARISPKDKTITLLLAIFLGYLGFHYFYVGKIGIGLLYLFTVGLFFIGWIIDIFKIASGSFTDSNGLPIR
jgi:restriction system protein